MPDPTRQRVREDLLMILLCAITSAWLLASPLVPVVSDGMTLFFGASLVLTLVLAAIGVKLNHLAARHAHISLGRGKRR
jgi:uncharacterized membrane protein (DUF485 family)